MITNPLFARTCHLFGAPLPTAVIPGWTRDLRSQKAIYAKRRWRIESAMTGLGKRCSPQSEIPRQARDDREAGMTARARDDRTRQDREA